MEEGLSSALVNQNVSYGPEANANAKTELVAFCQRKSSKSMEKGDIVYKVDNWNQQFQATVKLNCLGGEEFAGELCQTERQAEQAAAHQVLLAHAEELAAQQSLKRKALEAANRDPMKWARLEDGDPDDFPDPTVKGKLHTAVKQLLGREADNADIVYEIGPTEEGMVAQLTLPTLSAMYPTEFGGRIWIGEPTPTKQGTRLNAAAQACRYIMTTPQGSMIDWSQANLPDPMAPKNKGVRKPSMGSMGCGKGFGKGCGKGKEDMMAMMMGGGGPPMGMMGGPPMGMMGGPMGGPMGCKGKGMMCGKGKDGKGKGKMWDMMAGMMGMMMMGMKGGGGGCMGGMDKGGWGGGW